jgi:NAD(P)-dependent dehydrogenase (short-subunit alcohol dehydrogenase family)
MKDVSTLPTNCHQGRNVILHQKDHSNHRFGRPRSQQRKQLGSSLRRIRSYLRTTELTLQPDAAWTRVLGLNLHRPFTLTQKLYPLLKNSPSPRIIHIGSISAIGVPGLETYAYSASKAGLHHLSRVLAVRLGKEGFTVNTIACGPFESKMMKETLDKVPALFRLDGANGSLGT